MMKSQWIAFIVVILNVFVFSGLSTASTEGTISAASNTKFNGLFQFWGVNDTQAAPWFNMKVKKAELKFSGSVIENTRWAVMADPAKSTSIAPTSSTDNKILQDLIWGWSPYENFEFVVGQFKVPNSGQSLEPSGDLIFAERAMSIRAFSDYREPGFMMSYKWNDFKFQTAATNGGGNNVSDTTNSKDITARVDYKFSDSLKFGIWGLAGDWHRYGTKGRFGGNARYVMNEWDLAGELINDHNGGSDRRGFDVEVGYMLNEKWQPCARVDGIDGFGPNAWVYSLGLNYFINKNATKINAVFSKLKDAAGNGGAPLEVATGNMGSLFVVSFQTSI